MANKKVNVKRKLKPAEVYIFNHEKFDFDEIEEREGSGQDVAALRQAFEKFDCEVNVITDPTKAIVKSTVKNLEQANFEEHSALVICVLSHGDRNEAILAKDSDYSLDDDVLFPLLRNRTLVDKPKILIVQACKGAMIGLRSDTKGMRHANPNEVFKCYGTYEGFVSYRDPANGSSFIQTFCELLEKDGKKKHIEDIMRDVRAIVTKETREKQIPSVVSTLTKTYTFGDYMHNNFLDTVLFYLLGFAFTCVLYAFLMWGSRFFFRNLINDAIFADSILFSIAVWCKYGLQKYVNHG